MDNENLSNNNYKQFVDFLNELNLNNKLTAYTKEAILNNLQELSEENKGYLLFNKRQKRDLNNDEQFDSVLNDIHIMF
jgi:hypothetical protein